MRHPVVALKHLDNLWFQVTGTLCNIACTHCFNSSGPNVRTFGFLSLERVRTELETAASTGVKEAFFTGGEPFLHPDLLEMISLSLESAPTTVLTNGTLINDRIASKLAVMKGKARYSLEIRVSLDGYTEETNDAIRGAGLFRRALAAIVKLCRHGLLPLVTVVRTWRDEEELATLAGFTRTLEEAGYSKPRIKVLPAIPLGRELTRPRQGAGAGGERALLTEDMLTGFDVDLLMCSNSRLVTDHGVWVCPLLVEMPDGRLGSNLNSATTEYELRHSACHTCFQYGTICGNINASIEGPVIASPGRQT